MALNRQGTACGFIANKLGLHPNTVKKYILSSHQSTLRGEPPGVANGVEHKLFARVSGGTGAADPSCRIFGPDGFFVRGSIKTGRTLT
jgi:hypothetical protein